MKSYFRSYTAEKVTRQRLSSPSIRRTVQFALQSIRLRFIRCLITAACVIGAIAFLEYNALFLKGWEDIVPKVRAAATGTVAEDEEEREFFSGLELFTADKNVLQKRLLIITLSILVAMVGITNSMMMSIKERYREIATLKCLGAVNSYIRELFLIEAFLQGGVGSAIGLFLGLLLYIFVHETALNALWIARVSAVCFGIGLVMTILASIWPIHAALVMMPVEALRVEE